MFISGVLLVRVIAFNEIFSIRNLSGALSLGCGVMQKTVQIILIFMCIHMGN